MLQKAIVVIKLKLPGYDHPVEFELGDFSLSFLQTASMPEQKLDQSSKVQDDELVSTEAMAEILQKSPSTLRNWVREGKISVCRVGRSVFFNKRAVIEKIQNMAEKPSSGYVKIKKAC